MNSGNLTALTALTLLAVGGLWLGWWRRQRGPADRPPALVVAVLMVGIVSRLAFVFLTPVFYAPDEQAHFNYIKFLSEHQAFPVETGKLGDPANDWEYCQPPFYYAALVPAFRAGQALFHGPAGTVRLLRLFSVLLWLLNVWFGAVLLKRMRITDPAVRLFVMAMVCLLPTYTFVSAAINNDNLLATLGGGLLCLMSRRETSRQSALGLGVVLGLALLTKQSAIVFLPAIVLLSVLDCRSRRVGWAAGLSHLGIVLGVAALIYFPWALRNWQVYGTSTPEFLVVTRLSWPSMWYGLASAAHNLVKTFWAVAGISNNIGYPFPLVGMLFLLLCVAWHPAEPSRERRFTALNVEANGALLAAAALAALVNVALVLRFGYLFGMGQGRHLFPVLYPIALLLAVRWRTFPVKHLQIYSAVVWMAYAIGFTVFSVWRFQGMER